MPFGFGKHPATLVSAQNTRASTPGDNVNGPNAIFQDDLLDRLVGKWKVTGTVHGSPSTQTLDAEWVLNHQFLRIHQKSAESVAGTNVPYEGVFFIGYDDESNRYIAHLMNVFGGRDSETLGYGQRNVNEIKLVFTSLDATVASSFTWKPKSGVWDLVSTLESPKVEPILELRAIR